MTRRIRRQLMIGSAIVGALLLVTVGFLTLGGQGAERTTESAQLDMRGNPVQLDPGVTPSAAVTRRMQVTPSTGKRLVIPSVGLNVPLGALNVVDNTITPPGFTSAYLVRNLGAHLTTPDAGTVYVVAHAIRGGGVAPGNYLADLATHSARVSVGAEISAAGVTYRVTGVESVNKTALPTDRSVWTNTPNRLVIVTCLERADGKPATDNLVVYATRTGP